ncbi:DUF5710 domain-containing protein [Xanthomonas phage BUDD]|nr:DUF5710 domain-containing protein [Xanthomonas phage BUDD]
MSEGANVTAGVANPDNVMPPEKPQKRKGEKDFAKEINAAVSQAGKKLVESLLEAKAPKRFGLGDKVKLNGKPGRITSVVSLPSEDGKPGTHEKVSIKYDDGKEKTYMSNRAKIVVVEKHPHYDQQAQWHLKDAEAAKRGADYTRHHDSMAKYHVTMIKHHEYEGDIEAANKHRDQAPIHRAEAKKRAEEAAKGGGFVTRREMDSKARQSREDHLANEREKKRIWDEARKTAAANRKSYKHYYAVPFGEKDEAKAKGFKWDPTEKKWYITSQFPKPGQMKWKASHSVDEKTGQKVDD